jgi:hypothetical protein
MVWSLLAQLVGLGFDVLRVLRQSERDRAVEVLLLRQQLRILERKQACAGYNAHPLEFTSGITVQAAC